MKPFLTPIPSAVARLLSCFVCLFVFKMAVPINEIFAKWKKVFKLWSGYSFNSLNVKFYSTFCDGGDQRWIANIPLSNFSVWPVLAMVFNSLSALPCETKGPSSLACPNISNADLTSPLWEEKFKHDSDRCKIFYRLLKFNIFLKS